MVYYFKFTFISFIENLAMMVLMMSVYKLNYRGQIPKIIVICLSLIQLSYVLRENGITFIVPFATVILWMICMWLLFPLRLFHAAVVTVSTFLAFGLIQGIILFFALFYISDAEIMSPTMNMVSFFTVSIVVTIAFYVHKRNWGFSFVPEDDRTVIDYRERNNKRILLVLLIAGMNVVVLYALTIIHGNVESFLAAVLLMLPTLGALVYLSLMKEIQQYTRKTKGG